MAQIPWNEAPATGNEELDAFLSDLLGVAKALALIGEGVEIRAGQGDPENVVPGNVGSLFLRTDGGVGSTLYVKESGASTTGWAAK